MSAALLLAVTLAAGEGGYSVAYSGAERIPLLAEKDDLWRPAQSIAWGPDRYKTRFRALWNESGLFVRFEAQDPEPWWTMTKRDEWLWQEEVVEVFLDVNASGRDYAEVEISPGNVICDVRMVSPWPNKEMDYSWNLEGIESRVYISKDAGRRTTGWTAVAFMPWSGFRSLPSAQGVTLPPEEGERWRFNAFRVERPHGKKDSERDVVEAAFSPPKEPSFHVPAAFRDFVFHRSP